MCCSVASYSRDELGEDHVLLAVASYSRDLVRVRQRSRCKECGGGGPVRSRFHLRAQAASLLLQGLRGGGGLSASTGGGAAGARSAAAQHLQARAVALQVQGLRRQQSRNCLVFDAARPVAKYNSLRHPSGVKVNSAK
jgi:hypothetical protein